jgi:hypothetical protein
MLQETQQPIPFLGLIQNPGHREQFEKAMKSENPENALLFRRTCFADLSNKISILITAIGVCDLYEFKKKSIPGETRINRKNASANFLKYLEQYNVFVDSQSWAFEVNLTESFEQSVGTVSKPKSDYSKLEGVDKEAIDGYYAALEKLGYKQPEVSQQVSVLRESL